MRGAEFRHRGEDRNHHRVAKLTIGLRIRYRDAKTRPLRGFKAHQPGAFARRQPARPPLLIQRIVKMLLTERPVPAAIDENFGTIFIVAGRKRPPRCGDWRGQPCHNQSHYPAPDACGHNDKDISTAPA